MSLKDHMAADLDNVFFNDTEFTDSATFTGMSGPIEISVYFDTEDDVVFDGRGDLDSNVSASVPSVTCKSADVADAKHGDMIVVNAITYYVIDMDPPVNGTRKLYLSEDQP
jgi:hypothetical protein